MLGLFLIASSSVAQEAEVADRTLRIGGEATVTAEPDRATIRFGVVSRAETAEEARASNASAAKTAMNAVRDLDVPEANIRMETLRLQPQREYNPETKTREERGFEATRMVVVDLRDLEQLPRLVARIVQRGANRLEGIEYEVGDRAALRNEALQTAARNAREKAGLLASALGATVGPVREITEEELGVQQPRPRGPMQFAKSAESDAAPEPEAYSAGEIEVSAQVHVVFDLLAE